MAGFTEADVPEQSGKTFLVTGANTGLGLEASRVLAQRGARVVLACRDQAKAEAAMSRIRDAAPNTNLAFIQLDQADLSSVRRAAEAASREPRIDVLINNAGVMFPPLTRTKEGFELQFGVNHLGVFALTSLLLSKLAQAPAPRVVVTASLAHQGGDLKWDDLDAHKSYNRSERYCDSKLANLLFMLELDKRLRAANSPVKAFACHPGVARTELMRHSPGASVINPMFSAFFNTAALGAVPALQAATDPNAIPGEYYGPQGMLGARGASGIAHRAARAKHAANARRLWDVSIEKTGIDPGLAPA